MIKNEQFKDMQGGVAITLLCVRSATKEGWGKKLINGSVEIYIPVQANEVQKNQIVICNLTKLLSIKANKIEIIEGKNNYLIVTILDVLSEQVNKAFENIQK